MYTLQHIDQILFDIDAETGASTREAAQSLHHLQPPRSPSSHDLHTLFPPYSREETACAEWQNPIECFYRENEDFYSRPAINSTNHYWISSGFQSYQTGDQHPSKY